MAEDFRLLILKKNSPVRDYDRSTDLYKLSEEKSEDPSWNLMCSHESHSDTLHKKEIEETGECPSQRCETPEVDGIPESVRELLNLLVIRASSNQNEDFLGKGDIQSSVETNEIYRKDESWTSSMATPLKDSSATNDLNDSTLINFKFETSDLEVMHEGKSTEMNVNTINIDQNKDVSITKDEKNCAFHVFDVPYFDTKVKNPTNILHGKEDLCSESEVNDSSTNGLENLLLLSITASTQDKIIQPVENATSSDVTGNSCFETLINSSVDDEPIMENELKFLMSTPVKEYSVMNVRCNPIKNSFNTSILSPGATDICSEAENNSLCTENLEESISILNKKKHSFLFFDHTCPLNTSHNFEDIIMEKLGDNVGELVEIKDDSIFEKTYTSLKKVKDSHLNSYCQDTLVEVPEKSAICDTGLMETVIINENDTTVDYMPFCNEKTTCNAGLMETVMIDENVSTIECIPTCNEKTFCGTDQMATAIIGKNDSKILSMSPINKKSISGTDQMAAMIVGENDSKILCLSPINQRNFCDTGQMATVIIDTNDSKILCMSPVKEQSICDTDQLETIALNKSDTTAMCMSPINNKKICSTDLLETLAINESDSTAAYISPVNEKSICVIDQQGSIIINGSDSTAVCMSSINEKGICVIDQMGTMVVDKSDSTAMSVSHVYDKNICGADQMDTMDVNEHDRTTVCMSVNEQEELARVTIVDSLHVGVPNRSEETRKEPEYVTQVLDILCSPVGATGTRRQSCIKGKKRKSTESPEADKFVESKKMHHDNEIGNHVKESGTAISTSVIYIDSSEQKINEVKSLLRESPIIDECKNLIEKDPTSPKCGKNEVSDKQLRVNEEFHRSSQLAMTENVDKFNKQSKEKAISEELISCNLNSSLVDNFFSDTVIFDCDRIANQYHVDRTDNSSMANSADVFPEVDASSISVIQIKKEKEIADKVSTSSVNDVVIKTELEEDSQSHHNFYSQDYLSCSVLEEVCKATEALAYYGNGKNDCMMDGMDCESEIEICNDNSIKVEIEDNPINTAGKQIDSTKGGVKKGIKDIDTKINTAIGYDNDGIIPNGSLDLYACQSDRLVTNIKSDIERKLIPEEEDSKQNLRKKILFTIPECITLDDDIESWEIDFTAKNEVKEIMQDKNSNFIAPPVQAQPNSQLPVEAEPCSSKSDCVAAFKAQKNIKKFVYPKHGKKFDTLIPKRVKPEDLMASAVALEKCSSVLHNRKKSDMEQLKNKSLVCFNVLKINTDDKKEQAKDSSTSWKNEIISQNKLDCVDNKISSGSKSLVTDQLNDDSEELSYLLAAVKEDKELASEETINNVNFLKGMTTESQEPNLDVSYEKEPYVDVNMLNVEEIQKEIGIHDDSERCVSPIFRKRIKVKKAFKRNGQNSCKKAGQGGGISKLNEGKIEKSLNKTNIISSENTTPVREGNILGFSTDSGKKELGYENSHLQAKKLQSGFTPEMKYAIPTDISKKVVKPEIPLVQKMNMFREESTPARASGNISVSEKAMLQAKKIFSEEAILVTEGEFIENVTDTGREALAPAITSDQAKDSSTPARSMDSFGFSTASGKKVEVSEKSLFKAKERFLEGTIPSGVNFMGFVTVSGKKVSISEKAMLQAKELFPEEPIPIDEESIENSSVSGKKASIPNKTSDPAKKISFEDSSTPARTTDSFGLTTATVKKVVASEKSRMQAKKLCLEDSTPARADEISVKSPIPAFGHVDEARLSEFIASKDSPVPTPPVPSRTLASDKSVIKTNRPNLGHNSPSLRNVSAGFPTSSKENTSTLLKENVKFSKNKPSCPPPLINENFKVSIEASASMNQIQRIEKQNLNITQDFHLAESQGDNYIKAVDLALLNSSDFISADQGPPSPVFKISNRRRLLRNTRSRGKKDRVKQDSKDSSIEKPSATDNLAEDTGSIISSQSSCPSTQKNEVTIKEKEMDGDLAEESWWDKHCDLTEAINKLENISQEFDVWAEARKRQEEVISSKKNVRPVIGRHLQERKSRVILHRSSLRELVGRKRPGRYSKDQLRKFNVRETTASVTSCNAAKFQFQLKDHYRDSNNPDGVPIEDSIILIPDQKGMFGAAEAQAALLAAPGVDPSLLPPGGWCQNHYRWIVWKLASSERSFPEELGGRYLTPENIMRQLKYRWDREVDCGERPALRKILEMDDTASKRMVLCISSIEKPTSITASKKLELDFMENSTKLELTDGWYAIRGVIDTEMAALIQNGKLAVGTKIVTSGAELINSPSNGCHPLEPPASKAAIRLSTNSTRRARWDTKLGYVCRNPGPLPVTLHSLLPGGGPVGALRNVILARTYPTLNIEKTPEGRKVVRSQKAEARVAANYEHQRKIWLENICSQVSAEIQKEEEEETKRCQRKRARSWQAVGNRSSKQPKRSLASDGSRWKPEKPSLPLSGTTSPEELLKLLEDSEDPSSFQSMLTSSQLNQLTAYRQEAIERRQRELEDRVRQRIKQEEDQLLALIKSGTPVTDGKHLVGKIKRDVVSLFKVRIIDADRPVASESAVLTIWRPSEEVVSLFSKEGVVLTIYGVTTNGIRSGFLQLSTSRQTRYKLNHQLTAAHTLDRFPSLQRVILFRGFADYGSQQGSGLRSPSSHLPPFGEIDLVATVIRIGDEPNKEKGHGFQNIVVAGSDGGFMSIAFWGGIREFAVEDILLPGVIVVATNLQWRRHHSISRLPTVHAVDTSTFTQHPGEKRLKTALKIFQDELDAEMQLEGNVIQFIDSCQQKLDQIAGVDEKDEERPKTLAKAGFCAKSCSSLKMANEKLMPITPSVAARMKKLQMSEGAPEVSLSVRHIGKSAAVRKAFQSPVIGISPKSCDSKIKVIKVLPSDHDSSPMSLDSDDL